MATSIRLKRVGAKKQASYRIVVIDSREGTSGASVERLGIYNPRTQPSVIRLNAARALHWLHEGAEPSHTVRSLLQKTGVWKQFHDGVTAESLEEAIVLLGPAPGAQGTSARPMPSDKAPEAEAEPAKKAAKTEEAPAEAETPAEEPEASAAADEDVAVEPEPKTEETPEVADAKAETEGGEPVAEAVETVEETEEAAETDEEAPESEPAAGEAGEDAPQGSVEEGAVAETEETEEAENAEDDAEEEEEEKS